ncbi:hypothetical protein [Mycobacterium kyogaense]|uniref:hypothetical protein n=1 Tax=Mycobacterium kyogaense TaxID=2212479 RepID=UPI0013C404AE|nr:hypothetical protein [Mycobacterium kyogaense]
MRKTARRVLSAIWRPKMPVAVFAATTLALGVVTTVLAFGGSDPAIPAGQPDNLAPPGYSLVYRFVGDVTGVSRSDLPADWICVGEGVKSPFTSCFAKSDALTVDQVVSIGTLLVGAFSAVATLFVGLRGLRRSGSTSTIAGPE